jgi:Mrp family chromosome partitioning ATPase
MGRIAEALKRAQHERTQRQGQAAEPSFSGTASAGPIRVSGRASSRTETFSDIAQALLNPPPPPQPFPIVAPPVLTESVGPEVVALHDPGSATAEKYRSVRTRLITGNPGGGPRVLAVTSAMQRDGKTVTTANLGFCLSELKYLRVAVVDVDFHNRGLSCLLGAGDRPGVAEVLRGELSLADVCMPVVRDNLYLIPAGDLAGSGASELLASKYVGGFFREITERFHYGLIDTPPLHNAADTGLIAPMCHAVIMVVRMNRTPEPLLNRCVKMLQANRVTIAGCILAGYTEAAMSCDTHDYYQSTSS